MMLLLTTPLLVSSFLALSVGAVPVDSAPDACGPKVQNPDDPQDSCFTKPPTVDSAAPFGVIGSLLSGAPSGSKAFSYDWATCNPVVNLVCNQMFAANFSTGRWFFATGPAKGSKGQHSTPCQMGFWIPNASGAAGRPGTLTSSGKPLNRTTPQGQCQKIFQTMLDAAASKNPTWIGASINLVQNPGTATGAFTLPGGGGTGQAVSAGYPSYVVAMNTTWTSPTNGEVAPPPQQQCVDIGTGKNCTCDDSSPTCVDKLECAGSPYCHPGGTSSSSSSSQSPVAHEPCEDLNTGEPCTCSSTNNCVPSKPPLPSQISTNL